jgi:hypothetical protein
MIDRLSMNKKCTMHFHALLVLVRNHMIVLRTDERIKSSELLSKLRDIQDNMIDYTPPYPRRIFHRYQAPIDAVIFLRGRGSPGSVRHDERGTSRSVEARAKVAKPPYMTSELALESTRSTRITPPRLHILGNSRPISSSKAAEQEADVTRNVDDINLLAGQSELTDDDNRAGPESESRVLTLNSSPDPTVTMTEHMLTDFKGCLSIDNWRTAWEQLPAELQSNTKFEIVDVDVPCWTCTPSESIGTNSIPLTIAGAPVVIPIMYSTPIRAGVAPPKDPYPNTISPCRFLSADAAEAIFDYFSDATGCYILLNGFLQLHVPAKFGLEQSHSTYPRRFGGLKVSFLPESTFPVPTSNPHNLLQPLQMSNRTPVVIGSAAVAKPSGLNGACKSESAKFGIKTQSSGDTFLTVSTHLITAALKSNGQDVNSRSVDTVEVYSESPDNLLVR